MDTVQNSNFNYDHVPPSSVPYSIYSHNMSNRLKNVEDNIKKIQEDIKVLVFMSVQQSEMAHHAKERENEAVSDILSEGLELLEASFKLREDNGKVIGIISKGVELLDAPFKQVTYTLPNRLKNMEDHIEKEDDVFERLDMLEDSFKKENEVISLVPVKLVILKDKIKTVSKQSVKMNCANVEFKD